MKSRANSAPVWVPSRENVHCGPPTMNSTLSDRVKGFLKRRSVSHSLRPPWNMRAAPTSISGQSLMGVNSTATEGPKLDGPQQQARKRRLEPPWALGPGPDYRSHAIEPLRGSVHEYRARRQPLVRKQEAAKTQARGNWISSRAFVCAS